MTAPTHPASKSTTVASDPRDEANAAGDGPGNFVADIVREDLAQGLTGGRLMTRFPPEPNGFLHIGHAKSICLNFGLATLGPGGVCNLRFDDTNPEAEDELFVESIREDVRWLGFDWAEREYYASDYFEQLYTWAERLIEKGLAYVDSQNEEAIREQRGSFHKVGSNSPYRDRSVEENLALFRRMRAGELEEGEHVLRAKIDMESKDLKLRDPLMYRIRKVTHHRTGDAWCIYPMYDWAHGQSDAIEGITHSVCTLEFQNHRPLYEWFLEALELDPRPRQIEFARLNLTYTVLSKRRLQELVAAGRVDGWDDPRMPTLAGMRRRGHTAEAIRSFADRIGVARRDGIVDVSLLEHALRTHLNATSPRVMAVLNPLRVVLTNFPEDRIEEITLQNNPEDADAGSRAVTFSRELYIERDDFLFDPPKKWFRLAPGREVRLRGACIIRCDEVIEENGEVVELRCTWDPDSWGGSPKDGRKVRGTLHWVSQAHAIDAEIRLYDRLFRVEEPSGDPASLDEELNPDCLVVLHGAKVERSLGQAKPLDRYQFERLGYFCVDRDSDDERLVFNRTITLRDSWAKEARKGG